MTYTTSSAQGGSGTGSISVGDIVVEGNIGKNLIIGNNNNVYEGEVNIYHGTVYNLHVEPKINRHNVIPQPPRPLRGFIGRNTELGILKRSIAAKDVTFVYGPEGIGKTSLVKQVANSDSANQIPDGTVYLEKVDEAGKALGFDDVVQYLFDTFYASTPPLKVNLANAGVHLNDTAPLVILDGFDFSSTDFNKLPDLFPKGALLVTGRTLSADDDVFQPFELSPLTREDTIKLLEIKSGIPADTNSRVAMDMICELCGDIPLAITKLAKVIQHKGLNLSDVREKLASIQTPSTEIVQAAIERSFGAIYPLLSNAERETLNMIAAAPGISVDRTWLESVAQDSDAVTELEILELIQANSPRMRIAEGFRQVVIANHTYIQSQRSTLLAYLLNQLKSRSLDFDFVADELGNILGLLEWATTEKRWNDVVALGRAIDPYLTLRGLWDAWEKTLKQVFQAAQNLKDQAIQAWVLHQLGSREIGVGSQRQAVDYLVRALRIREALGDKVGAAYTRHNLNIILPPSPPEPPDDPKSPPTPPTRPPVAWIISGVLVILAIIIATIFPWRNDFWQPTPTPTGCPTPAGWHDYIVQEDDTLDSISQRVASAINQDVRKKGVSIVRLAIRNGNCIDTEEPEVGEHIGVPVEPVIITPTPVPTKPSGEIGLMLSGRPDGTDVLNEVDQTINYVFEIRHFGGQSLDGTISITDDKETVIACPEFTTIGDQDNLFDPQETITCTSAYKITQADLDNGVVTNVAIANIGGIRSNEDSDTLELEQKLDWELSKVASPTVYRQIDQEITYTYTILNTGNVTLFPVQFAITDDRIGGGNPFNCGSENLELAPNAAITCTSSYKITQADIDARSVTNGARASIYAFGYNLLDYRIPAAMGDQTAIATVNYILPPTLVKTADRKTYEYVNEVIKYTYAVKNINDVPLPGPVTVKDDKVIVSCPALNTRTQLPPLFTPTLTVSPPNITPTATFISTRTPSNTPPIAVDELDGFLFPNETIICTGTYSISQDDLDFGLVSNTAIAHVGEIDSNLDTVRVDAIQRRELNLIKTANPTNYDHVGQLITYTYEIKNVGNVTLGPAQFTVLDDQINNDASFNCGLDTTVLAPNESFTCTNTYSISPADLENRSITNEATASVTVQEKVVISPPATNSISCTYPPEGKVIYVVRNEDTLFRISGWYKELDMTVEKLMKENCLSSTVIRIGQIIYVPHTPKGSISGIVVYDENGNNTYDPGDPGAPGVLLELIDNRTNTLVASLRTDSVGHYLFSKLDPGEYRIIPFPPEIPVSPGQDVTNRNFVILPVY